MLERREAYQDLVMLERREAYQDPIPEYEVAYAGKWCLNIEFYQITLTAAVLLFFSYFF